MEYIDRGGNRWVRIRFYDVKGNLVERYDSYNGDEIASSISDGIFPADFATAGTQPTPDTFAQALDNLRISTCGGVESPNPARQLMLETTTRSRIPSTTRMGINYRAPSTG